MNKSVNSFGEFNVEICVRFINPETLRAQNFARNDTENAELAALKQQHFLHQRKNLHSKYFYGFIHGHTAMTLNYRSSKHLKFIVPSWGRRRNTPPCYLSPQSSRAVRYNLN